MLAEEIRAFVTRHRACGELSADVAEPTLSGSRLWIACPCGARFDRWITAGEVMGDLGPDWPGRPR